MAAADEAARFVAELAEDGLRPVEEFVREPRRGRWLTLEGLNGCGKTMLAQQIFAQAQRLNPGNGTRRWGPFWGFDWIPDKPGVSWVHGPDFAARLRAGEYALPERYAADWCVVFDELGADRDPSGFVADCVYRFCAGRVGKWTVITTNLTVQEIADRIDARVASRILRDDNRRHLITATDYALTGRWGGER